VRPRAVLALCLVALVPAAVAAQTTLSGRVIDQVGNPMSGVTVEATANQGTPSQTTTDANGTYHFDALFARPICGHVLRAELWRRSTPRH
jgi:protocatechuate 3,4-dioxygenase beta subunit